VQTVLSWVSKSVPAIIASGECTADAAPAQVRDPRRSPVQAHSIGRASERHSYLLRLSLDKRVLALAPQVQTKWFHWKKLTYKTY